MVKQIVSSFVLFVIMLASISCQRTVDIVTAIGAVAATLGNIGPGLGGVGPTDNYANIPVIGKS